MRNPFFTVCVLGLFMTACSSSSDSGPGYAEASNEEAFAVDGAAPQTKAGHKRKGGKSRAPASVAGGKGRMSVLTQDCEVFAQPATGSEGGAKLKAGKQLWVQDALQAGWEIVQRKSGPGYMAADCFQN